MPSAFGKKMKELRTAAKMSQQQLAIAAKLSVSFVSKLEQSDSDPSWTTVQAIAKALGVDCTAFSNREDLKGGETEKPTVKKKGGKK